MGIRKDLKKYIKGLKDEHYDSLYTDEVIKNLEEILRRNKREKAEKRLRNEYVAVKQSDITDSGDTIEAIRDGVGIPPIGYKYVKIKKLRDVKVKK